MRCPYCQGLDTRVVDSRLVGEGEQVRRRRQCSACGERFTTHEGPDLVMPRVVKSDGRREPFDEQKLRLGFRRALEKRPVATEALEAALRRICKRLSALGEREVAAAAIGEHVMEELRGLDEVAYVRFASVYRRFEDVGAFREVIEGLEQSQRGEQ
ncbi:transcriptional regulator NrdR [Halorhodospira neutriphila]|uniref:Transcriptional repressor NrdR n=1 Tax=Halorhodospira neutriphila TaxID=168379 RepID=A0ABS1E4X7_9GAMM|nr:transcriptional regulator NrdR [Halorhodospira neutriphila]MBK1726013.1 transcriptional regulator NrdR [Halorhodospira neutriphila]